MALLRAASIMAVSILPRVIMASNARLVAGQSASALSMTSTAWSTPSYSRTSLPVCIRSKSASAVFGGPISTRRM